MPSYSGVWNLVAQYQAKANLEWPQAPGAPTSVSATAGDAQATVSFTAPTFTGVPPGITGYLATSSPGGLTATGAASPLTVTGLTNGTAYTFNVQATNGVQYGPVGTSGSVTPAPPPRIVFGGGQNNVIQYVTLSTTGNTSDFGDLYTNAGDTKIEALAACASTTTGVFGGGFGSPAAASIALMQYITIASTGNSTNFGNLSASNYQLAACNSSTRGVFGGGLAPNAVNTMNYITISSTGNSTTFGQLTVGRSELTALSSSTRGVFSGGKNSSSTRQNVMDYITIASTGNATDFGDLSATISFLASASNSTRGIIGGGTTGSTINTIQYITIASTGNATSFGDLTVARYGLAAASSTTTVAFAGGVSPAVNVIDKVTIATTGNATDFGDLLQTNYYLSGLSAGNGGTQ